MTAFDSLLGMTTWEERAYAESYSRKQFTGRGAIVDLGCWLGSTTIPLAVGLSANLYPGAAAAKIHAYDKFVWEEWMEPEVAHTDLKGKLKPGGSFFDEFLKRMEPWKNRIIVYPGDLCEIGWHSGKIEFLLVDAMKSWELTNCIVRDFYPSLIGLTGFVLQQDFAHFYPPWIHLIHYRLRDFFEPFYDIPHSYGFVFRVSHVIPAQEVSRPLSFEDFSEEEIEKAFDYAQSLVSEDKKANIAAAKVMLSVHTGNLTQARIELDKHRANRFWSQSELPKVEEWMRQM